MQITSLIILIILFSNFILFLFSNKLINYFNIFDYPNKERKFHKKKVSLLGGSIIFFNISILTILNLIFQENEITNLNQGSFFLGAFLFYILGLYDDKNDLNSNLKFIFEIFIICLVIFIDKELVINKIYINSFEITLGLGSYSFIFTVFCVIIFINALNMYDGINLQSGSYCLIIAVSLFIFSEERILLGVLIISLINFLYLNFKSKVFLGDSGTYLLGFVISYLIIYSSKESNYLNLSADKIFILMMLPGLELIRLFVTRLSLKRHPFSADRNHIHHILLKKIGYNKTIIFLILSVILPILLLLIFQNYLVYIILFFILFYLSTIYIYGK